MRQQIWRQFCEEEQLVVEEASRLYKFGDNFAKKNSWSMRKPAGLIAFASWLDTTIRRSLCGRRSIRRCHLPVFNFTVFRSNSPTPLLFQQTKRGPSRSCGSQRSPSSPDLNHKLMVSCPHGCMWTTRLL